MAKAGLWLQGARGKFAGSVLKGQAGGGTQIAAIPTSVANPKTNLQVQTRSKFKLLSQLGAAVSDVIAIPREGAKSSRNIFTSVNSDRVITTNGVAQITLENVQITKSARALPQIIATRNAAGAEASLAVSMASDVQALASRVVYVIMRKNSEGSLEQIASRIIAVDSENATAAMTYTTQDLSGDNIVIWAYGILDKNAAATVKYGDMKVEAASDIAKLITNKTMSSSDYAFTQTRGGSLVAGETEIVPVDPTKVRVYVTAAGDGTVAGGGTYTIGSQVTVTATAVKPEGAISTRFTGWRNNSASGSIISTDAQYTFTAPAETVDLVAVFSTSWPSGSGGDDGADEN